VKIILRSILVLIILPIILLILDKVIPTKENNMQSYYVYENDVNQLVTENGKKLDTTINKITKLTNKIIDNPTPNLNPLIWENEIREDTYSKTKLNGNGPLQYNIFRNKYVLDPFDILILGDGYSMGQFGDLNSFSYPYILEDKLNKYNNGRYRVTVLGSDKSSFLRQSDWITEDRLEKLQPDLIILTYTMGRYFPTFYEKKYCREFNICIEDNQSPLYVDAFNTNFSLSDTKYKILACLQTNPGLITNLFRKVLYPYYTNLAEHLILFYCNDDKVKKASEKIILSERTANFYKDPSKTIYFNDFIEYIQKIKNTVKNYNTKREKLGKNLTDINYINITMFPEHFEEKYIKKYKIEKLSISNSLLRNYSKYGIDEISTDYLVREVLDSKTWQLRFVTGRSNKGICDYDCIISSIQMKKNIKNYLNGTISNPLRIRHGVKISNAIANDIYYHIKEKYIEKDEEVIGGPLIKEFAPYYISYKEINSNNFIIGNINNKDLSIPCARVNHPHFIFSLNHNQFNGSKNLIFSYIQGEIDNVGISIEYIIKNQRKIKETFLLNKNEKFSIKYKDNISSIYVSQLNKNCSENGTSMDDISIMVTKK